MAQLYLKPTTGERLLIFGDGDEAIYDFIGNSNKKDYFLIKFRPTPQMRFHKQIPETHYNVDDRWIYKIYRKDLCFQISFDPDFPVWVILCDYNGNEDTQMIQQFDKCEKFIARNRELEIDKNILQVSLNTLKRDIRKKAQYPSEEELDKLRYLERINKVKPTPQQPSPMQEFASQEQ